MSTVSFSAPSRASRRSRKRARKRVYLARIRVGGRLLLGLKSASGLGFVSGFGRVLVRVRVRVRVGVRVRVRARWGEGVLIRRAERGVDGTRPVRHHAGAVARAARLQPNELWQAAALATAAALTAVAAAAAAAAAAIPATGIGNEGQCAVR